MNKRYRNILTALIMLAVASGSISAWPGQGLYNRFSNWVNTPYTGNDLSHDVSSVASSVRNAGWNFCATESLESKWIALRGCLDERFSPSQKLFLSLCGYSLVPHFKMLNIVAQGLDVLARNGGKISAVKAMTQAFAISQANDYVEKNYAQKCYQSMVSRVPCPAFLKNNILTNNCIVKPLRTVSSIAASVAFGIPTSVVTGIATSLLLNMKDRTEEK